MKFNAIYLGYASTFQMWTLPKKHLSPLYYIKTIFQTKAKKTLFKTIVEHNDFSRVTWFKVKALKGHVECRKNSGWICWRRHGLGSKGQKLDRAEGESGYVYLNPNEIR